MSDPTVIAFLTKLLCKHGGRLPRDVLPQFLELSTEQIDQILQDEPHRFPQVGGLVLAQTAARICSKYLKNEPEEECDKLHLCRHYLQGRCWRNRRPPCTFSHDIFSSHNQLALKANGISGLNDDEIKVLLLQNDNQLLPEVCVKYLHDQCNLGKDCSRLHICGYFTRGECNRRACKRSHHLMEFCSDLLLGRCRMSEVSVQNFQMISSVRHNEHLQSRRKEPEKRNPAGRRGRGRPTYRIREDSQDVSRGRQQERTGSKNRERSSSRLTSKSMDSLGWSGDDDGEVQKFLLDQIMDDWFKRDNDSSPNLATKSSSILQFMHYSTPTVSTHIYRSDIQSKLPAALPKVSSQPEIPDGILSSSSTSSAPQPKQTITPVTTAGTVNAPSTISAGSCRLANVPDDGPTVSAYNKSPTVVNPSTTLSKDSSVPLEKPVMTPSTSPYSASPAVTAIGPFTSTATSPSIAPSPSYSRLVDSPTKGPSVPLEKPVMTPAASPYSASPPAVTAIGLVTSPAANPSTAPSPSYSRLLDSPTKGPSVSLEKPVMTPAASPYSTPPAVTAIGPVTSPAASPSTAPSPSYSRLLDSPTKGPSVPLEKSVQSSVRSAGYYTSMYGATYVLPKSTEPDIALVICLSNVWKHCKLGKLCPHLHYYLPYCWQINKGTGWEDLSNMEEIERQYCEPKMDRIPMIDFLTMRSGMHRVRRLSTVSSVEKPSEYVLTTEWLWYWRDEYGTWTQYGHSNVKQVSANILSSDFENIYLSDSTADITFIAGNQSYEINFREMKQKNLQHKTEKDVRRRPRFVSFEDVKLLKGRQKEQMKKNNHGRDVKEVRLFHGTEKLHIDAICNQNFDWRIWGTHGTVYGQDASYSHNYCTPTPSGIRMMFVAHILVGDYVVGNSQMKRPPQRPGSSTQYYDSCVDDVFRPSIFVVFEKHQIYPEYLLEYEEKQKQSCVIY
ncbi:hypothetical protein GDO78_020591 [Eleutherodactylus coqui]|uniref:CCCH-type zinc finger antiviral protein n=1 Tax=Eleutherodactylus coqui TaxID=57060 RepID=A0A8J6JV24_ELECQ|nr:hypothetical protein GDO78_020591 [Eleutherodactylus coqui]